MDGCIDRCDHAMYQECNTALDKRGSFFHSTDICLLYSALFLSLSLLAMNFPHTHTNSYANS